jgi:hypothetical protein
MPAIWCASLTRKAQEADHGAKSKDSDRGFGLGAAMIDSWGELRIEVADDEIIVSLAGNSYSVTYYKLPKSPQLLARNISHKDDSRVRLTLSEFLARA